MIGLDTLALRMDRHMANTLKVAIGLSGGGGGLLVAAALLREKEYDILLLLPQNE